ncbi:hypothetical protein ACWEJ6_53385 [Nonomuraea sp. NPDC004702]
MLFRCAEDLSDKRNYHTHDQRIARSSTSGEALTLASHGAGRVMQLIHTARTEAGTVLEIAEWI